MSSMLKRSLIKTITWRLIATLDTFFISWFITGKLVFCWGNCEPRNFNEDVSILFT